MAFADPFKLHKTKKDPMGPLRGINRVVCGPKPFYWTSALLMVWSRLPWPSAWHAGHTT